MSYVLFRRPNGRVERFGTVGATVNPFRGCFPPNS